MPVPKLRPSQSAAFLAPRFGSERERATAAMVHRLEEYGGPFESEQGIIVEIAAGEVVSF